MEFYTKLTILEGDNGRHVCLVGGNRIIRNKFTNLMMNKRFISLAFGNDENVESKCLAFTGGFKNSNLADNSSPLFDSAKMYYI